MQTESNVPGGFAPVPCKLRGGSHAAIVVFHHLRSTPGIWEQRDDLEPYQVRASRSTLAKEVRLSPDKVRGALAVLVDQGYLVRLPTAGTATAVYEFTPKPIPKMESGVSRRDTTGYATAGNGESPSQSPRSAGNPQANPQDVPKPPTPEAVAPQRVTPPGEATIPKMSPSESPTSIEVVEGRYLKTADDEKSVSATAASGSATAASEVAPGHRSSQTAGANRRRRSVPSVNLNDMPTDTASGITNEARERERAKLARLMRERDTHKGGR